MLTIRNQDELAEMEKLIVETRTLKLDLPAEGFRLHSGEVLPEVEVAYETYGTLNSDGDNAICICPTLTSDAHAAGYHRPDDTEAGWWDYLIGPGRGLDTKRFFVICTNVLGGCKGTTGPQSINPETGSPYGSDFPLVTIKDAVRVQKLALIQLGVTKLHCVVGGSLGGMQSLEWAISYPDFVDRCVCIAAGACLTPQALAFDVIARQEIEHDPAWQDGRYHKTQTPPTLGLSRARQIGHITYLSSASMTNKFGRETQDEVDGTVRDSKFSTEFQVESYLDYQGRKFTERFDANSYLYITRMLDMFDLVREHGGLKEAFAKVKSRFLIVSIRSDWLFPPEQQLELVEALIANGKDVSYFQIKSELGHDAFLLHDQPLAPGMKAFVEGRIPESEPHSVRRLDQEDISRMVQPDQRVLDIGSGSGEMMLHLVKTRNASGICLDYDVNMVIACMQQGLNAVELDADTALSRIADNSFDLVLLNQTIQQLHSALQSLKHIVRIGATGIVGFPNFAYYQIRFRLLFRGVLPMTSALPFEWYETPNIHLITICDFIDLCQRNQIRICEMKCLAEDMLGSLLVGFGLKNLGAERAVVRLTQNEDFKHDAREEAACRSQA